mmetsp:Transcript_13005/g.51861  ORF Transcript_13005/g.51861 Transcript_13005/m.51861 type:complete len:237 (-) Transcript_13005:500-1210(-)
MLLLLLLLIRLHHKVHVFRAAAVHLQPHGLLHGPLDGADDLEGVHVDEVGAGVREDLDGEHDEAAVVGPTLVGGGEGGLLDHLSAEYFEFDNAARRLHQEGSARPARHACAVWPRDNVEDCRLRSRWPAFSSLLSSTVSLRFNTRAAAAAAASLSLALVCVENVQLPPRRRERVHSRLPVDPGQHHHGLSLVAGPREYHVPECRRVRAVQLKRRHGTELPGGGLLLERRWAVLACG